MDMQYAIWKFFYMYVLFTYDPTLEFTKKM